MPSRWYRSRLFWFGLMGLVMLLGMWLGYSRWIVTTQYNGRASAIGCGKDSAGVYVGYIDFTAPDYPGSVPPTGLASSRHIIPGGAPLELFATGIHTRSTVGGHFILYFAFWLIAALYTAAWVGGLIWWQTRKHRLISPSIP